MRPDASSPKPSGQLRRTTKESVTFVRNNRQQQALNKDRSAAASFDQCCYVEWCADFHPVHYMKALEELLGKESVYQLMKISGHVMVGLARIEKAERLVENGLTINNTFLRAFPYRRKAEKIILGNLPIAVREEDIIEALRPYCQVVSLAYEVVSCNGYTWTTGNRKAFVILNEGRKLHQLPAKLVIISKVESTPAYIIYGVRCSRCHRQGHRRATCPQGTGSGPVLTPPPSQPTPSHSFTATTSAEGNSGTIQTIPVTPPSPAASSPAESCPVLSQNTPATKPSAPAPSTSALPYLLAPSSTATSPTADPDKDQAKAALTTEYSIPKPQTIQPPQSTSQKIEDLFEEDQLIERQDVILNKVDGSKKRPHDPDHAKSATKKGCVKAPRIPLNSSRPRATPGPSKVHECQTTRQKQATFRVRSAARQAGQCVYLEFSPDFTQEEYFRRWKSSWLIEEGLNTKDVTLRAFPLRKRAERIVLSNVLFFVEDVDLVNALRPYGQVTSIIQKMMQLEDFCWADARWEAFITLRDGVKLSQIPARLDVKAKVVVTNLYVT
ncbi:hypothetical protein LAZ67_20001694 [Cordylochernes scorpioides]|uniref:CCHC-type domain-containing protein n=1 Tax=Cordylochernes scorpioides TaxID=51811 RepID=A0ABY6LKJ0_9ARAC|nr:hypothetical protein LAZ67_20001694 [Cordylochernes scorpioides]